MIFLKKSKTVSMGNWTIFFFITYDEGTTDRVLIGIQDEVNIQAVYRN